MVRALSLYLAFAAVVVAADSYCQTAPPFQQKTADVVLLNLFQPTYPPLARAARITGEVTVSVTVRPDGSVESAVVESGHPMLKQAAVDSASKSRFDCRACYRTAFYRLVYTFDIVPGTDCCTAFDVQPKVQQQQPSTDLMGRPQTHVTIAADGICICDPAVEIRRVRSVRCLYLWKCVKHETLKP